MEASQLSCSTEPGISRKFQTQRPHLERMLIGIENLGQVGKYVSIGVLVREAVSFLESYQLG